MPHQPPQLPTQHRPVSRVFQLVAIDLVIYNTLSRSKRYILSVIDHLTRFAVFIPIADKAVTTIALNLVNRIFSLFGPVETLHLNQEGTEFENT